MRKQLVIIFLFTLFLNAKTFTTIEFQGDIDYISGEFDRDTLLKICHIEYPAIYKIWKSDPTFEKKQIGDFIDSLEKYSKSMGYYDVVVNSKIKDETIVLIIQKNRAIKINSIDISDKFKHFALFEKGKRFRTRDFTSTKKGIVSYLEESGYPKYRMNAKAYVDLDLYRVDIKIEVNRGEKYYFGESSLLNFSNLDQELIDEQIVYKKGELFQLSKIEDSYDNIYQLGVFDKIKMQSDFNSSDKKVNISIALEEGKDKEVTSMIGYDTWEGARGKFEYIDHNFFGNLREFRAEAKMAEKGYRLYTGFYDPKVVLPVVGKFSLRNELSYQDWKYDAYAERLLMERVTFGKNLIDLDHFFGFQLENNSIESDNGAILEGSYLINSLFYRLVVDKRDSKMDAKNGYYSSLYIEKAMKELASEIDYLKILAEGRYIKEIAPMVFAFKLRAGQISKKIPVFKHFFAGGAMSNRGYEYRDLGPHINGDAIGGVGIIDMSLESRYYLSEKFAVVSFIDATTISQKIDRFDSPWEISHGIGVRYLSIIGPLRFDIGFRENRDFAIHLGIGQVF